MENIDVNEYRHYLENFYIYKYDENTFLQRKAQIDRYSDSYLQKIIDDTNIFVIYLIDNMETKQKTFDNYIFTSIEILDDIHTISSNCIGGWHADELYCPIDFERNFWISKYIIKRILKNFNFRIEYDVVENYNEDEEIGCVYSIPKLFVIAPIKEFEQINNLMKQQKRKELLKILKNHTI